MQRKSPPQIVVFKESLFQSVLSDVVTFGCLIAAMYASGSNPIWTLITGALFVFFGYNYMLQRAHTNKVLRFYSYKELQDWIDNQQSKSPKS